MQEILPPEKPLRERSDGWTAARRQEFCTALAAGSTVTEACALVGKSTTSAYKARDRVRGFRNCWDEALDAGRPNIEAEVMRRGVHGWDEPVFHAGKQVGVRRRYSDTLLKAMYNRGVADPEPSQVTRMPIEEVHKALLRRLEALARRARREAAAKQAAERAAAAATADRMRAAGLCP